MKIPGHFRAFTIWFMVLVLLIVGWFTWSPRVMLGFGLVIIGSFFGDQATHLAQPAHSDPAETAIERWMQNHRWLETIVCVLATALGLIVIFSKVD